MASITFRNVSKRFGDTVAVDNVSFDVKDNEFFCLFGPPLSGKSTILKLILGLETPDAGEILIGGRPVNTLSPAERNVAMVFQNLALFPHMTAEQNVRFPLVERKVAEDKIKARVASVSEKLHIGHLLHKLPAHLSGGERQRVAIARALVRDPAAYLMDDPISALDARLREETRVELKRIQRELGHTLIYVTHDQEEAIAMSDRIAVFNHGRIVEIGPPRDLYKRPSTRFVAGFLGENNFLAGRQSQGDSAVIEAFGTRFPAPPGSTKAMSRSSFTIWVRPEDVRLGAASGDEIGFNATVVENEFVGALDRVVLRTSGGEDLVATLGSDAAIAVAPGQFVDCRISPSAIGILPGEPSGARADTGLADVH